MKFFPKLLFSTILIAIFSFLLTFLLHSFLPSRKEVIFLIVFAFFFGCYLLSQSTLSKKQKIGTAILTLCFSELYLYLSIGFCREVIILAVIWIIYIILIVFDFFSSHSTNIQ